MRISELSSNCYYLCHNQWKNTSSARERPAMSIRLPENMTMKRARMFWYMVFPFIPYVKQLIIEVGKHYPLCHYIRCRFNGSKSLTLRYATWHAPLIVNFSIPAEITQRPGPKLMFSRHKYISVKEFSPLHPDIYQRRSFRNWNAVCRNLGMRLRISCKKDSRQYKLEW